MCGILGVASTEGMKNRSARHMYMKMGLDIDSWRGWESTGLALVPEASKDAPIVYKRALNGRDFIQLKKVEKYLDDIEKYSVAIGHNRAATTGRGNIVDHNAHPFQYGNITLVHNGHIRNTHELKDAQAGAQCLVDSAHVAYSMDANGELETLQQVDGGFCFVWWNSLTGILNIARNTERPLHMAYAAKENTFYFASEATQLLHLMKDIEIDEEMGLLFPKAWNWYQFNLKNLREYTRVPFVKRQGRQQTTTNTTTAIGPVRGGEDTLRDTNPATWTDEEWAAWEEYTETKTTRTRTSGVTTSESADSKVKAIKDDLSKLRQKDAKIAGVPTSPKRLRRAKMELKSLGIEYNSIRNCVPISWVKYKNQENLGTCLATTKKDGHWVEVLQVRYDKYLQYHAAGLVIIECVNVRRGPTNDIRIVGAVSSKTEGWLSKLANKHKEIPEQVDPEELSSTERKFTGPGGSKVSLARFLELTHKGCGNCQGLISATQHEHVVWVGSPSCPLCPECGSDNAVLQMLGFASNARTAVH